MAFLEAKRRDPGSARFGALDVKQARRIEKHSPSARLLLYDRDPVVTTAMVPPPWVDPWGRAGAVSPAGSYSVTVPITHYTATGVRDRRLYRWGHPFSYQFVFRYLQGLDLDLRPAVIASATGFADARDVPTHLLFVRVAPIGEPEPDRIPVNPDLLDEIRQM